MLYGVEVERSEWKPLREGIGSLEPTAGGNLAIRIGRELGEWPSDNRWQQVAYIVLTPRERRELAAYLMQEEGVRQSASAGQVEVGS